MPRPNRRPVQPPAAQPPAPAPPQATPPPAHPADPVLDTLQRVVDGIVNGTDISRHRDSIEQLISGQESRAELVDNLLLTHEYERVLKFTRARQKIENELLTAVETNTLPTEEQLAVLDYFNREAKQSGNRIKAGSTSIKDILSLLNKVDYTLQISHKDLEKRLAGTTPQGREIIRRAAYRMTKLAKIKSVATRSDVPDAE